MDVHRVRKLIAGDGVNREMEREEDQLPKKADLEAIVEGNTECGKCKGKVRALIEDAEPDMSPTSDIDFKLAIYCPAAGCDWKVTQWRPWSKARSEEL